MAESETSKAFYVLPATTYAEGANASADFRSQGSRGIALYLDIDSSTGDSETCDVKLQAKSPNGDYIDVTSAAFAQKTGAGTSYLTVYPGIAETANVSVSDVLPRVFRVLATVGPASVNEVQTLTLSAGAENDTFDLTFNAHESVTPVTIPAGGFANVTLAQVQATAATVSDWSGADAPVITGPTGGPFVFTFSAGALAGTNVGAITVTSKTGAADGSVAETTAGVTGGDFVMSVSAHLIP